MMARYSLVLTAVFAAGMVLAGLATKVVSTKTLYVAAERQAAVGELTSMVEEAYSGNAVIRAFGLEKGSLEGLAADADELARTSAEADFLTNAVGPTVRLVGQAAMVVIAVMAGGMLLAGQITVGVFQAFFQYVNTASEPLTELVMTVSMLQAALAAAERVLRLLDADEVEADPALPAAPAEPVHGRVAFEHVRFGYSPSVPSCAT